MDRSLRVFSESEANIESFHDCHVHGLHWERDGFTFSMDLQYILEWIAPASRSSAYKFSIAKGQLTFRDVDELKISMDWSNAALDAEIATLRIVATRTTLNGRVQRCFEIEFSDPEGIISLWSTGYELRLLQEPVASDVTTVPQSDT